MSDLRGVKQVVGVMTLILILMLGGVAWGLIRANRTVGGGVPLPLGASTPAWRYALPSGTKIISATATGPYLALLVDSTEGEGKGILVLNPSNGTIVGEIRPSPPDRSRIDTRQGAR